MKRRRRLTVSIRMSKYLAHALADMLGWEISTRDPEFTKVIEGKAALSFIRALRRAEAKARKTITPKQIREALREGSKDAKEVRDRLERVFSLPDHPTRLK